MDARRNSDVFARVWELYASGRTGEILDHLHPAVEWSPVLLDPATYHGHDGVHRWAHAVARAWKSITLVADEVRDVAEDCVVASGRIAAFDYGGEQVVDSTLSCVAEFRRGLVVRARTFVAVDEALAWVSARPVLP
jgi:hypothetical protein